MCRMCNKAEETWFAWIFIVTPTHKKYVINIFTFCKWRPPKIDHNSTPKSHLSLSENCVAVWSLSFVLHQFLWRDITEPVDRDGSNGERVRNVCTNHNKSIREMLTTWISIPDSNSTVIRACSDKRFGVNVGDEAASRCCLLVAVILSN